VLRWGRNLLLALLVAWSLLLAVRCHLPRQTTAPDTESTSTIYLVRHGWHAGIAVQRADLSLGRSPVTTSSPHSGRSPVTTSSPHSGRSPVTTSSPHSGRWPVLEDFPDAQYLEVGWGEASYYPGTSRGVWGTLRAGAWPTGSVVHVVPITDSVHHRFSRHTIVRIPVSQSELNALTRYVAETFALDDEGNARPAADGYYLDSRFYHAGLPYHLFNNCNHWAAGALEAAGCDTAPRWTLTVGRVVAQARDCGTLIQRRTSD